MGIFGKVFGGGEKISSREAETQTSQEDYPAFRGENNYENVKPKTEAERQAEISDAREAVKNAYRKSGETNRETLEMDFETVEKKTGEFFDSLQGLCEGMNLFHSGRYAWPKNNSRNFMEKFGGEEFRPQKNPDMYTMMCFATLFIDAEAERRKLESSGRAISRDEKIDLFNKFQYPSYKVYIPQEMGGSAWKGFDKNKFEVSNPSAGLGGTYEKFFGSDENPERKALAEKAISLYNDLAPFMDKNSGMRTMNKFLAENRGKTIEGFKKKVAVQEVAQETVRETVQEATQETAQEAARETVKETSETIDLTDLRDKRNEKIDKLKDEIDWLKNKISEAAKQNKNDTVGTERMQKLISVVNDLNDEKIIINGVFSRMSGDMDKMAIKNRLASELSAKKQVLDLLTDNRSKYEKGSEEYNQNEKNRNEQKRWIRAITRVLEKDFKE